MTDIKHTIRTVNMLRAVRDNPDKHLVFVGADHCAIHDGSYSYPVSRAEAILAIHLGGMNQRTDATNGATYFT